MRRLSIIAVLMIFSTMFTPATADDREDALAAIQACRSIAADQVRLVCLDAATQLLDSLEEAAPSPVAPVPPVSTAEADAAALAAERAQLAAEREALAKERAELARAAEETQAAQAAVLAAAESERLEAERAALEVERAAIETRRAELEREEAEALANAPRRFSAPATPFSRNPPPAETPVTIVKITVNKQRVHKFFTSDGDVLIQEDTSRNLIPPSSLPAGAIIHRTALGAKWIAFDERPKRRLKVKLPPLRP